jgi:hypothetical protein
VNDAGHYRFIDLGGSVRKWGLEEAIKPSAPETWRLNFGDIDDRTSQEIVIRLTSAFFGRFLKGRPSPILTCPSAFYPQIEDRTAQQTSPSRARPDHRLLAGAVRASVQPHPPGRTLLISRVPNGAP